jgi:hypothetical protein
MSPLKYHLHNNENDTLSSGEARFDERSAKKDFVKEDCPGIASMLQMC